MTVDERVGDGAKRLIGAYHRRRFRRHGWEGALPARSHVHITGWHLEPSLNLVCPRDPRVVLGRLLAERAETTDVRVLVWAGAPVPLFQPTRAAVRAVRERPCASTRIQCALDSRERPMHCHREKTIVVDDQVAFVGGIDRTNLAGDRFDISEHGARRKIGWYDVATELEAPVVGDVADHFVMRWREVTGETLATPVSSAPAGEVTAQVVRTVPEGIYDAVADGDPRLLETYLRTLRDAQRFIYLENQFLSSPEIVDALRRKLRDPPHDDFRLVVLLPAKPNNGQDDTPGQLAVLAAADDHAAPFLAVTVRSGHGDRTGPLFVRRRLTKSR